MFCATRKGSRGKKVKTHNAIHTLLALLYLIAMSINRYYNPFFDLTSSSTMRSAPVVAVAHLPRTMSSRAPVC